MVRKASLGVEPYVGKVLEDQNGPIDATLKTDPWARQQRVPTPEEWVQFWVGKAMRFQDSFRHHHLTDCVGPVMRAAVLKRWLLNGEQGLMTQAECDVVLAALQRDPADPVDPMETPQVRSERDQALGMARNRVVAKRGSLS